MGIKIDAATMENSMEDPQKLKTELPYDPVTPLLGIYPKKTLTWKDICTSMFITALYTIAETRKQSKHPSVDEENVYVCVFVYVCVYIYIHVDIHIYILICVDL